MKGAARQHLENPGASRAERLDFDVVIVGAGPAGSAAAIQLAARDPSLAPRTLLLDRAVFPRDKLCGGGLVRQADRLLAALGVQADVPSVPIHSIRFEYAGGSAVHRKPAMFRVVRREEFDHALVREARSRGVTVREGEAVARVARTGDGVCVATAREEYRARIVIAADGANSIVRRALVPAKHSQRFVALEVLTDPQAEDVATSSGGMAVFDFRPAAEGLRGYYWDFPCVQGGRLRFNRGIGGTTWPGGSSLDDLFAAYLERRGISLGRAALRGATAPLYDPALPQGAERVLIAGDAVGIDPWFGEGISVAIGTGMLAAHAAADALEAGSFDFSGHHRRIRDSAVGWQLRRNRATGRRFYRAARRPMGLAPWLGWGVSRQ